MSSSVEIILSHKINKSKWDACIHNSSNGLIYATSVYLNHMTDDWRGIIVNDYDCVMPLPWRRKFGIKYCYHVPFIQQLGWFKQLQINDELLLFEKMFHFLKYGDYYFNFQNTDVANTLLCSNYVLDLSQQYNIISQGYNTDLINNLKKAYNMMNSITPEGRKKEANHFLFDSIFKEFAGSNLLFDFEGSDIPGIKSFYEKFGSVNQAYYKLHFNHLPFPLNILKR